MQIILTFVTESGIYDGEAGLVAEGALQADVKANASRDYVFLSLGCFVALGPSHRLQQIGNRSQALPDFKG